jgi:hypothetical protein
MTVFGDPLALSQPDEDRSFEEERWIIPKAMKFDSFGEFVLPPFASSANGGRWSKAGWGDDGASGSDD